MNIFITNDDGIGALGLRVLAKELSIKHNVVVIAPTTEKSAMSHSLTIKKFMDFAKSDIGSFEAYSLDGTPADCVKFFMVHFKSFTPDFVLSGINNGWNMGRDVHYSGTVSAAVEGALLGCRSVALSAKTGADEGAYSDFARFISGHLETISGYPFKSMAYNINYPDVPEKEVKGCKLAKLSGVTFNDIYESKNDTSFMLTGEMIDELVPETDIWHVRNGFVSVTPLISDITDYSALERLKKL